jgi:hypothetical protein
VHACKIHVLCNLVDKGKFCSYCEVQLFVVVCATLIEQQSDSFEVL